MIFNTKSEKDVRDFFKNIIISKKKSHKGQNGRVLIIGGSSLFHASSIWAAEVASYFSDIVHYSSTKENNEIFLSLKKRFINGIIISQKELLNYVQEDDVILVGPGMLRGKITNCGLLIANFNELLSLKDEALYTYFLTKYLIEKFPEKKFVFDAGSLQMMERDWLLKLKQRSILTPHQGEFEKLFGISIKNKSQKEIINIVKETAVKYKTVILLKAVNDYISDGDESYIIEGGNQGLTKGGTGDVLAGLVLSFFTNNSAINSAVAASLLLKKTSDRLFNRYGYWYNIQILINKIPLIFKEIIEL